MKLNEAGGREGGGYLRSASAAMKTLNTTGGTFSTITKLSSVPLKLFLPSLINKTETKSSCQPAPPLGSSTRVFKKRRAKWWREVDPISVGVCWRVNLCCKMSPTQKGVCVWWGPLDLLNISSLPGQVGASRRHRCYINIQTRLSRLIRSISRPAPLPLCRVTYGSRKARQAGQVLPRQTGWGFPGEGWTIVIPQSSFVSRLFTETLSFFWQWRNINPPT